MDSLSTDDFRIAGNGPINVVMTHGTLMDHTMFDPQMAALEDDYRCLNYNLRAATSQYATEYDLVTLADDCENIATSFGMERFILIRMSMGGYMVLEFALRYPEKLQGLILIDSMAGAYSEEKRDSHAEAFEPLNGPGTRPRSIAEWCVLICFGPATRREQPELVQHWLDKWVARPARSVFGEYQSWIDKRDLTPSLGHIHVPTLVKIEGAGHTSNLESPEQVKGALCAFLSEIP